MTAKVKNLILYDGSNVYHRLKSYGLSNLLNFDFNGLNKHLSNKNSYHACYYVGAIRTEKNNPKSYKLYQSQRQLFSHLHKYKVDLYKGYMLKSDGVYHEKGVDVQIAIDLVVGAYENLYQTAYLLSSDTDLIPAITKAQNLGKTICYVGFQPKVSRAMLYNCRKHLLLTKADVLPFVS